MLQIFILFEFQRRNSNAFILKDSKCPVTHLLEFA